MTNYKERVKKIDASKMNQTQQDALAEQLGGEISKIMDEANNKCNEALKIYGLQTQIGYKIVEIPKNTEKN